MGTAAACVNANRRCAGLRTVVLFPSWLRHSLWHSPVPGLTSWGGGQGPALVSVENPSLCGRQGSRAELEGTASGVGLRGTLRGTA